MRVVIAGPRKAGFTYSQVETAILSCPIYSSLTEIVSGHAIGVDRLGEQFAAKHGIPVKLFLPDWDLYGKRAGFVRNEEMARYADGLIAIWDGVSKGTMNMIDVAKLYQLVVYVRHPA